MGIKLILTFKSDRVNPSRFQDDYYILVLLREQIKRLIQQYIAPLKNPVLVDFGCGDMPYRQFFEPYVARYIGVDVPAHEEIGFKAEIDVFLNKDNTVPLEDNSADVVFSIAVLEHVDDPNLYLRESYRLLKPGGKLILSTPGYWIYHPVPTDYWRWTAPGLRKIITAAGFQIDEVDGLMGLAPIGLQLFQDGLRRKLPKFVRPYFVYMMQLMIQLVDRFYSGYTSDRDACMYTYIATKPLEK